MVVIIFVNFVRISQTVFKFYGKHDFVTDGQTDKQTDVHGKKQGVSRP